MTLDEATASVGKKVTYKDKKGELHYTKIKDVAGPLVNIEFAHRVNYYVHPSDLTIRTEDE